MFAWLSNLFAAVNTILWLGATGFLVGAAALFAGRIVGGPKAYLAAGGIGALLVLGTYWTGVVDRMASDGARAKIASLEAANAKLRKELALQLAANAVQEEVIAKAANVSKENEALLARLKEVIESHKDDETCTIHPDEMEIIEQLQ